VMASQRVQPVPFELPPSRTASSAGICRQNGPSWAHDEIEEISDDDARPNASVRPSTRIDPAALDDARRRFPDFCSLAWLAATGFPCEIDYRAQFEDVDATPLASRPLNCSVGARSSSVQSRGKKGAKRSTEQFASATNGWRMRRGRKVYIDRNGKQSSGATAFRAYEREGGGSSGTNSGHRRHSQS